LLNTFKGIA
jgi:hypothetical protein